METNRQAIARMADHAARSPAGRILRRHLFRPCHTGGGCFAWRRECHGAMHFVLVTYGSSEIGTGADPCGGGWMAGIYREDGLDWACKHCANLSEAIAFCDTVSIDPESILPECILPRCTSCNRTLH